MSAVYERGGQVGGQGAGYPPKVPHAHAREVFAGTTCPHETNLPPVDGDG